MCGGNTTPTLISFSPCVGTALLFVHPVPCVALRPASRAAPRQSGRGRPRPGVRLGALGAPPDPLSLPAAASALLQYSHRNAAG